MARHPVSRRVHRQPTAPDDVFVDRVLETTVWARTHARTLIIGAVLLVVALVAFVWIRASAAADSAAAATELTTLRQTVQGGNPAVAIRDLQSFLERFDDTPAAPEARLMLARAHLEAGQGQQAIDAIQADARALDEPLGTPAAFLLGSAYESLNRYDEAEQTYLRIADGARFDHEKILGLENAARVRVERGNPAGAAELYDRLMAILPETSPDRTVYEMRKAEALALASRPASN
jgi:predicted negative regulator of RcsB-dependent stress response